MRFADLFQIVQDVQAVQYPELKNDRLQSSEALLNSLKARVLRPCYC